MNPPYLERRWFVDRVLSGSRHGCAQVYKQQTRWSYEFCTGHLLHRLLGMRSNHSTQTGLKIRKI